MVEGNSALYLYFYFTKNISVKNSYKTKLTTYDLKYVNGRYFKI